MYKYSCINLDGEYIEVEVTKEIQDFLEEDRKRVSREERQIRRCLRQFSEYAFNDFQLPLIPSAEELFFCGVEETERKQKQAKELQ